MKNSKLPFVLSMLALCILLGSCSVIGGIFKAGMGVGIFIVVLILVIIGVIVMRANKK